MDDSIHIDDMIPGQPYMVGRCEHCGKLYEAQRFSKRGHTDCMRAARQRAYRARHGLVTHEWAVRRTGSLTP